MSRRSKVAKSSLFCFTLMLALKFRHIVSFSWWIIFFPFFVFLTVSRGMFSSHAASVPRGSNLASLYAIAEGACVFFGFLCRSWRQLGRWLTGLGRRREQARIYNPGSFGYNTFSRYPPAIPQQVRKNPPAIPQQVCKNPPALPQQVRKNPPARVMTIPKNPPAIVKKRPDNDLTTEVSRLEAALSEQMEIIECSQQNYERLQNERECKICFEGEINTVLLPCRHRILCSSCSKKCQKCPFCRVSIDERLLVYDA